MSSEEAIIQLLFERNEAGLRFFEQKYKNLCLKLAFDITGNGESPLLSLERFGEIEYYGSIYQFVVMTWVIQLFVALIAAGIVTVLGALIKNKLYTLLSSFSLLFVPLLFKKIGLSQFAHYDISNGFDAEQLWIMASK